MELTITYFGLLADRLGIAEERIVLSGELPVPLRTWLEKKHEALKALTYSIAVDGEFSDFLTNEHKTGRIDVMPPFAGG